MYKTQVCILLDDLIKVVAKTIEVENDMQKLLTLLKIQSQLCYMRSHLFL